MKLLMILTCLLAVAVAADEEDKPRKSLADRLTTENAPEVNGDDGRPATFLIRKPVDLELPASDVAKVCEPPKVGVDMSNISLSSDMSNIAFCQRPDDQCAFLDDKEQIAWTSLTPGLEPKTPGKTVVKNFKEATDYCKSLEWAGYSDWRLPSFTEVIHYADRLRRLQGNFPHFGHNLAFVWTTGFPNSEDLLETVYDPMKRWAYQVQFGNKRQLGLEMKASFRCIRNQGESSWQDTSTVAKSTALSPCTQPGGECSFKSSTMEITMTAPLTYLTHRKAGGIYYGEARRFCASLNWNGVTGWRLPKYEEAYDAARRLLFSYSLSRDGVMESFDGNFWVRRPWRSDDIFANPNQVVIFRHRYQCNLASGSCRRVDQVIDRWQLTHNTPEPPRGQVVCVRPLGGNNEPDEKDDDNDLPVQEAPVIIDGGSSPYPSYSPRTINSSGYHSSSPLWSSGPGAVHLNANGRLR